MDELQMPAADFVGCVWQGLMAQIDWNARADQLEGIIIKEVNVR